MTVPASPAASPAAPPAHPAVTARLLRRRLRRPSGRTWSVRTRAGRAFDVAVAGAVGAALLAGTFPRLWEALGRAGQPAAPGRLFVLAAALLVLAVLAAMLRAAGPLAAGPAFQVWVLAAPLPRRYLLRPRFAALLAGVTVTVGCLVVLLARVAGTDVMLGAGTAALGGLAVTAVAVAGQQSELAARAVHRIGQALGAAASVGFGSLATGAGRGAADSALALPTPAGLGLLAVGLVLAGYCVARAARGLDRIGAAELARGQGLWLSARAAATGLDTSLLTELVEERWARSLGPVRPVRLRASFGAAVARLEWARLRRRPGLGVRTGIAVLAWWGAGSVLVAPALAVLAVLAGYWVALPVAATLRQLTRRPGLRAQFALRVRALSAGSAAATFAVAAAWTAAVAPGLAAGWPAVLALPVVLTAAVCRAATRPALDYGGPAVSTPLGDLPVDLARQVLRGPLLLAALAAAVAVLS